MKKKEKINRNPKIKLVEMFVFLMLLIQTLYSQNNFDVNGYQKYLLNSVEAPQIEDRLNDHVLHTRINFRWYPAATVITVLETRFRAFYGNSMELIPGYADQVEGQYDFLNLDAEVWKEKKSLGYGEIDRLYLDYTRDQLQFTVGRQRISWGTSLVWNIVDLFNPKSILDFDYEELPGSDAVRFQYYTGPVSRIEAVINPGKNKYKTSFAAMFLSNYKNYDIFLILGVQHHRKVIAGGWSGYVKSSGFRGEFKVSEAPSQGPLLSDSPAFYTTEPLTDGEKTVFSGVLSWDYTFTNTFYIHSEILLNSNGKKQNAGLYLSQIQTTDMLSAGRINLFQEFAYNINPLTRLSVFALHNPDDHSILIVPSVTWSVFTNVDLTFLGYTSGGEKYSEYGDSGNLIFIRCKYSF